MDFAKHLADLLNKKSGGKTQFGSVRNVLFARNDMYAKGFADEHHGTADKMQSVFGKMWIK